MAWGRNSVGRRASDRKKPEDVRVEIAVPRSVFIEERLEAGVAGAADGQARAVDQYRKPAVFAVGFDARHAFKIDDVRSRRASCGAKNGCGRGPCQESACILPRLALAWPHFQALYLPQN